jgi:predicted nucleic acid-binding protein
MIFVDTWAWVAMAVDSDQCHNAVIEQHRKLLKKNRRYVTSDDVVGEVIDFLYDATPEPQARTFVSGLFAKAARGLLQLEHISPDQFQRAWQLRQKYHDKPDISFTDFTSMIVMQDRGIMEVFTGDAHFLQVNLGFRLFP